MGARVVIAEDEAIIRLDLKEILESEGFEVVGAAARGDDAVALVREHQPDLAILDVKMPGMDGLSAAREINALGLRVAVLVLTAFSQRSLIEEAREAGVAAYLVKPFQRAELLPAIDVALARCEQQWAIDAEQEELGGATAATEAAEDKLETRRQVDRAKGRLMDEHGLGEVDAFSFIQKTAMASRSRMRDVASRVLDGTLTP